MKIRDKVYVSRYIEDYSRSKRDISDEMLKEVVEDYADYTLEGICLDNLEYTYDEEYEKYKRNGYVEFLFSREVELKDRLVVDFDRLLYSFGDEDYSYQAKKEYRG